MVSITLSVPAEVKAKMDEFPEMNWSGLVRQTLVKTTEELDWRKRMLQKAKEEESMNAWIVELVRKGRKGRADELRKMGLI